MGYRILTGAAQAPGAELPHAGADAPRALGGPWRVGDGERSRSQLLLKLGGIENILILAVNDLAVNGLAVNGSLHALYSVQKFLIRST